METGTIHAYLACILQHPVYTAFSLAACILAINRFRQYWRLRQFKGPFGSGVSYLWHSRAVVSGAAHTYYGHVTKKYGPIARVAPDLLLTSSPELWAHMNAVRSSYKRDEWYYHACRFSPGKDNVFTETDTGRHEERRKKMAAGYAGKENPTLELSIDEHVRNLIDLMRTKYAAPAASTQVSMPMNLATKIQYLTLDVISHVGLGKSFGDLKVDEDVNDYLKAMEEGLRIANLSFGLGLSWLRDLPLIGRAISPLEEDKTGFGRMMAEARKVINSRLTQSTIEKSDMLASFIRHGLTGEDLFQDVFETLLAGSDTTAAALRIILLYLMTHPRVYNKLQAEIDSAVKCGNAPVSPSIVSDSVARNLPYLGAVIREGMRVHPPVANLFPRFVPGTGDTVTVDGKSYFLPGNTRIGYSAWTMHRDNAALYGEDCTVFRPERWFVDENVPGEQERLARMLKANDMIFGYGRWRCLGQVVAQVEIRKTLFEVLRHFDMAVTNPHRPWGIFNIMGLFTIEDLWVNVHERA